MRQFCFSVALLIFVTGCTREVASPPPEKTPTPESVAPQPGAPRVVTFSTRSPKALELFFKGRDLHDNGRPADAAAMLNEAITLDPHFAAAHAHLGFATQGPPGMERLELAMTLAKELPEPERLYVEALHANRRGDEARDRAIRFRLAELAPEDARVQGQLALQLFYEERYPDALKHYRRAVELDPDGPALNMLGYTLVAVGELEEAIEVFGRYVAARPNEANPLDSLGEVQLFAGKFDDARGAFTRASTVNPEFFQAWHGLAQIRFFTGDRKGGYAAMTKAREVSPRLVRKLDLEASRAWALLGEGRTKEALALIDAIEQRAHADGETIHQAYAPVIRSQMLFELGEVQRALVEAVRGRELALKLNIPGLHANAIRRRALLRQLVAEARLGRADAAAATLSVLMEEAKKTQVKAELRSALHLARAAVAEANGDLSAAATLYRHCNLGSSAYNYLFENRPEDAVCLLALHRLYESDRPEDAEKLRQEILTTWRRDPMYLYAWLKLQRPKKVARESK